MESKINQKKVFLPYGECYGCFACLNCCSQKAIRIENRETGFYRPVIDYNKCVNCNKCTALCKKIHDVTLHKSLSKKACASKNEHGINNSSSGGVFFEIAKYVINSSGIVYGCTNENNIVKHIRVTNLSDIRLLQGSKYVQSRLDSCFQHVENDLKENKLVLFSGTPCQVGAIKAYLKMEYDNLITIDVFCHGVPSPAVFEDYIKFVERKYGDNIKDFEFRGKFSGWSESFRIFFEHRKPVIAPALRSSFYRFFLDSRINNASCASCQFKSLDRCGDISLGDCWGIDKLSCADVKKGVSSVFVNTVKGDKIVKYLIEHDCIFAEDKEDVFFKKNNVGALCPNINDSENFKDDVIHLWKSEGYSAIERLYKKIYLKKIIRNKIANFVPQRLRDFLKMLNI